MCMLSLLKPCSYQPLSHGYLGGESVVCMQQGQQPQGPRDTYPLTMTTDPSILHRLSSCSCTSLWVGRVWSLQIFLRGGYAEGPAHCVVQERRGFRILPRRAMAEMGPKSFSHTETNALDPLPRPL